MLHNTLRNNIILCVFLLRIRVQTIYAMKRLVVNNYSEKMVTCEHQQQQTTETKWTKTTTEKNI